MDRPTNKISRNGIANALNARAQSDQRIYEVKHLYPW